MRPRTTKPGVVKPLCTSVSGGMAMLGVGKNSFYGLIDDGEIEVVRLYGRVLPTIASLEALVARRATRKRAARADATRDDPHHDAEHQRAAGRARP
jgi:hypothetical protein